MSNNNDLNLIDKGESLISYSPELKFILEYLENCDKLLTRSFDFVKTTKDMVSKLVNHPSSLGLPESLKARLGQLLGDVDDDFKKKVKLNAIRLIDKEPGVQNILNELEKNIDDPYVFDIEKSSQYLLKGCESILRILSKAKRQNLKEEYFFSDSSSFIDDSPLQQLDTLKNHFKHLHNDLDVKKGTTSFSSQRLLQKNLKEMRSIACDIYFLFDFKVTPIEEIVDTINKLSRSEKAEVIAKTIAEIPEEVALKIVLSIVKELSQAKKNEVLSAISGRVF